MVQIYGLLQFYRIMKCQMKCRLFHLIVLIKNIHKLLAGTAYLSEI